MSLMGRITSMFGGQSGAAEGEIIPPRARPGSAYMRGGRNVTFAGWRPSLRQSQHEIGTAWDAAAARTADALHNSGWLTGAIEQAVANVVGNGLRLKPMPETDLIGMSKDEARAWIKTVERRWELWSGNAQECDVEGRRTFGVMQRAAFGHYLATGEVLGEVVWRRRPWNTCGTKFRLLSPTRLSRRSSDLERLVNGVYHDADGMPVGYAIREAGKPYSFLDRPVRARDRFGRPRVIHIFQGPPETCRGITPLAPVLQVIRQFDQLSDATLMASIIQTLFAATITGEAPTEEVMEGLLTQREQAEMAGQGVSPLDAYMDMVEGFYDEASFDVGINGRIAHLFPGQEMKFLTSEHPNGNYPEFSKILLREIARCLGLTYESATGDYHGATYASLGRAIGEIFEVTKARREEIVSPLCQPIYEAWLEEEIEAGRIPFPGGIIGFLENRAAACRALWRGGAKPVAEELKVSKADEIDYRLGVTSEQRICAARGYDYEDVLAERAEAMALRDEYGVDGPIITGVGGAPVNGQAADDDDEAESEGET